MISPPSSQRLSTCRRMVFGERLDEARCSMKGRKKSQQLFAGWEVFFQSHPGARPIIQIAAIGEKHRWPSAGAVVRFILEGFGFSIIRAMELTHDSKPLPSPSGFVYQHARFGRQESIEVTSGRGRARRRSARGATSRRRVTIVFPSGASSSFLSGAFWCSCSTACGASSAAHCGVVAEEVPWSDGKHHSTQAHMLFLARWARKLSWKETAEAFHTSWDRVCDAVEYVVDWGLEHRTLESIRAIGVDEIQYAKGHKYLTLVYQIDQGFTRLLWVGKERTIESFQGFFTVIGEKLASADSSSSARICGSPTWT